VRARYKLSLQTASRSASHAAWLSVKSVSSSGQYNPDVCLSSKGSQTFGTDPGLNDYSSATVVMGQEAVGDTLTHEVYFLSSVFTGVEASSLEGTGAQVVQWRLQLTPLAESLRERRTRFCEPYRVNLLAGTCPRQAV
jgi:hypothetical protein